MKKRIKQLWNKTAEPRTEKLLLIILPFLTLVLVALILAPSILSILEDTPVLPPESAATAEPAEAEGLARLPEEELALPVSTPMPAPAPTPEPIAAYRQSRESARTQTDAMLTALVESQWTDADVRALAAQCRFSDCAHNGEPGCAVQRAIRSGELAPERLAAFLRLSAENASAEDSAGYLAQKERKFKEIAKINKARRSGR